MKRARNKQLMLEDYLSFFDNHDPQPLTLDHLNAILSMNGFCKRKVKREVLADLNELEMMSPRRSTLTLRSAVYPCAPLTVDEVKADIRSIGWEECPVGSIVAVGSAPEKEPASAPSKNLSRPISATTASSGAASPAPLKKKKTKKTGLKGKRKVIKMVPLTAF